MGRDINDVLQQLDIQARLIGNDLCTQASAALIIREAQAEIARLQAEVGRLTRESYSKEWADLRFKAAHNDALEAAAKEAEARGSVCSADAIRALKRPVTEGDKA